MSTRTLVLILLSALALGSAPASAQDTSSVLIDRVRIPGVVDLSDSLRVDTTRVVELTLVDGTQYRGVVVAQDASGVQLRRIHGLTVSIPRAQVRTVTEIPSGETSNRFDRIGPNRTRLLFAPAARLLPDGGFSFFSLANFDYNFRR